MNKKISSLKGTFAVVRLYLIIIVAGCLNSCIGGTSGAAPTASIPLPSITVTTDVEVPSATASSLSLTTGAPSFAVTQTPIGDGVVATLHNLSRPLSDGNNIVGIVEIADGKASFEVDSDLVRDGDLLLIKAGNMWQVVVYNNPDDSELVTLEKTDLYSTLSYQNLKNFWSNNGIDVSDIATIDIFDQNLVDLQLDDSCFNEVLEHAFTNEISDSGLQGNIGIITALFWIASTNDSFDYNAITREFFQTGSWSDETITALIDALAAHIGLSDTASLDAVWSVAANATQSFSNILGQVIAVEPASEGETNLFCSYIENATTGEEFTENTIDAMLAVDDISEFNEAFGERANIDEFVDFLGNYLADDGSDWTFENDFDPIAVSRFMQNWFDKDASVDFDPDELFTIMQNMPEDESDTTGSGGYGVDFYDTWATVMFETFEDIRSANVEFDPETASAFWTMQIFGGGFDIEDEDVSDFDYYSVYNDFENDYTSSNGYGSYTFADCLDDPTICDDLFSAGGTTISDSNFVYDSSNTGSNYNTDFDNCGDGTCDSKFETKINCPFDCYDSTYASSGSYCGDGTCDSDESTSVCSIDCTSAGSGSSGSGSSLITVDLNGYYEVIPVIGSCPTPLLMNYYNHTNIQISGSETTYSMYTANSVILNLTLFSDTTCHISTSNIITANSTSCTVSEFSTAPALMAIDVQYNSSCVIQYIQTGTF